MTFYKAFATNCRFQHRILFMSDCWWKRTSNNEIEISIDTHIKTVPLKFVEKNFDKDLELNSNEWVLHPNDSFDIKLDKIVKE